MALRVYGDMAVNKSTITLCGYVAEVERWEEFNAQWGQVLCESGLKARPGYFHMTDFNARQRDYRDWTRDKRVQVFDRLLEIIQTTILADACPAGFGVAVGMSGSPTNH